MADATQPNVLSRLATPELVKVARDVAGFRMTRPEFASASNVSGVRTRTLTFSRRHDSRTMFATNEDYGYLRAAGAWTGPDRTAVAMCRRALRAAKIPASEVAGVDVQREMGQTAERLSETEVRVSKAVLLRKLARARRAVRGIPVWSSYATVGLTADGDIGSLEIHWPELSTTVLTEARVLQQLVKQGFAPPDIKGGVAESIDAGIIHSTAVGFFMDVLPVIRVVYAPNQRGVGRKPVLYLDRHGAQVAAPETIELATPKSVDRPNPDRARTTAN